MKPVKRKAAGPPRCSVCGACHWTYQPHILDGPRPPKQKPLGKRADAIQAALDATDPLTTFLAAQRARDAAYMRDYRRGVRLRTARP